MRLRLDRMAPPEPKRGCSFVAKHLIAEFLDAEFFFARFFFAKFLGED